MNLIFGPPPREYSIGCFGGLPIADADGLYGRFHSAGSANMMGYANPAVDAALEDIRRTVDPDEHERLLGIVQAELARDVPSIPLVHDPSANI